MSGTDVKESAVERLVQDCLSAGDIRRIMTLITPYLSFQEAFFHSSLHGDIENPLDYLHAHGKCRDHCILADQSCSGQSPQTQIPLSDFGSSVNQDEDEDEEEDPWCDDSESALHNFYDETLSYFVASKQDSCYKTPGRKRSHRSLRVVPYLTTPESHSRKGAPEEPPSWYAERCSYYSSASKQSFKRGTSTNDVEYQLKTLARHLEMFMKIMPRVDDYMSSVPDEEDSSVAGTTSLSRSGHSTFGDHLRYEAMDLVLENATLVCTRSDDWLDIYEVEEILYVRNRGRYLGILEFFHDIGEHIMAWTNVGTRKITDLPEPPEQKETVEDRARVQTPRAMPSGLQIDLCQATTNCIKEETDPQLFHGLSAYLDLITHHRRKTSCDAVSLKVPASSGRRYLLSQFLSIDCGEDEEVAMKIWLALFTATDARGVGRIALIKIDDL